MPTPDPLKFRHLVEQRMPRFEKSVKAFHTLALNYKPNPEEVNEIISFMEDQVSELENLFRNRKTKGSFRFGTPAGAEVPPPLPANPKRNS